MLKHIIILCDEGRWKKIESENQNGAILGKNITIKIYENTSKTMTDFMKLIDSDHHQIIYYIPSEDYDRYVKMVEELGELTFKPRHGN